MATRHVIVDGSNLATEGRSMPSLEQLDQAVREFIGENPTDEVTVVVDASFGHRIDPSELPAFEAAENAGEVVSPPAGAIGRGDAFLLRIAEKIGATVLSNDSFQEFHGEHSWLFEKGRLIGGKPVPGVGWIFMDRTPVRGAKSREVIKEAKRRKRGETEETGVVAKAAAEKPSRNRPKAVDRAIARATQEVVEPKSGGGKSRRRRSTAPPAEPVNEPLAFITFIAAHPLGNEVVGSVVEYSSHGAFVEADGARCYIPLSAMGDPAPRKAREVVAKGENLTFVVQAFDPQRRGIELALPGFAHVAGEPTAETVEAEISGEARPAAPVKPGRRRGAAAVTEEEEEAPAPARRRRAKAAEAPAAEAPGPEVPAAPEPVGEAAPAEEAVPARKAPARKAAARKAPAAKAAAEKAPAEKTPAAKKAAARKAPAKKAAAAVTEEATPAAPAKKAVARKAPAKKVAAKKAAPAAEAPVKKAPARKTAAKKAAVPPAGTGEIAAEAPAKKRAPAKKAAKKATTAVAEDANGAPDRPPVRRRAGTPAS